MARRVVSQTAAKATRRVQLNSDIFRVQMQNQTEEQENNFLKRGNDYLDKIN